jgi:hypothetical protein
MYSLTSDKSNELSLLIHIECLCSPLDESTQRAIQLNLRITEELGPRRQEGFSRNEEPSTKLLVNNFIIE